MTFFLVIDHTFGIFPPISLFQHISPLFNENYSSPLLLQIFPLFWANSPAFYIIYVYFPRYFDHDAFMHHPMHVLDAPAEAHVTAGAPVTAGALVHCTTCTTDCYAIWKSLD